MMYNFAKTHNDIRGGINGSDVVEDVADEDSPWARSIGHVPYFNQPR